MWTGPQPNDVILFEHKRPSESTSGETSYQYEVLVRDNPRAASSLESYDSAINRARELARGAGTDVWLFRLSTGYELVTRFGSVPGMDVSDFERLLDIVGGKAPSPGQTPE